MLPVGNSYCIIYAGGFGMIYVSYYKSPIGNITMASDGESLCGLWFDGQKYFASTVKGETEDKLLPVFEQTKEWLDIYFRATNPILRPNFRLTAQNFARRYGIFF